MPDAVAFAEIVTSIRELGVEIRTRVEALAQEGRSRDTAQTERSTRLEEKMTASVGALQTGLTTLSGKLNDIEGALPRIEEQAKRADRVSEAAVTSHDQLEVAHQQRWKSVMDSNERILKRLDKQDEDRDQIERQKKADREAQLAREAEEKKRESIAAKRVQDEKDKEALRKIAADEAAAKAKAAADVLAADEREKIRVHDENSRKNRMTFYQTIVLAVITSGCAYLGVRASHQDTSAKLDALSQNQAVMTKHIESVAVAVGSAEPSPALTSAAPAAAATSPATATPPGRAPASAK